MRWNLWVFLFCCALVFSSHSQAKPLRVLIDPGHGGRDSGATSHGLLESQLVLKIAKKLKHHLDADPRFEAELSRKHEKFQSLGIRVSKAHKMSADVLLSIHANSSPDQKARGLEVYFQNQLPPEEENLFLASLETHHGRYIEDTETSIVPPHPRTQSFGREHGDVKNILIDLYRNQKVKKSSHLAERIAQTWKGTRKKAQNTIRQAPFYVVSKSEIPTVLVEVGFVSNPKEAKKLKSEKYQKLIASSLYEGLIRYRNSANTGN